MLISKELLNVTGNCTDIYNTYSMCASMFISGLSSTKKRTILAIVPSTQEASRLYDELKYLNPSCPILCFSDYETLPYDSFSPQQELISNRLETLYTLKTCKNSIVIGSISALLNRIAPPDYVLANALVLRAGQNMTMTALIHDLEKTSYTRVSQVYEQGEFAVRGSLIDLFPSGAETPFRIDFFDDEIDSIRIFDPETQRTSEIVKDIRLLPAREFPIQPEDIDRFRKQYRDHFGASLEADSIYQQVSKGHIPSGIESYLPLFYDKTSSICDYLAQDSLVVFVNDAISQASQFIEYVKQRYFASDSENLDRNNAKLYPKLKPEELYIPAEELLRDLKAFEQVKLHKTNAPSNKKKHFEVTDIPDISIKSRGNKLSDLKKFLDEHQEHRILFSAYSPGRVETIRDTLKEIKLLPTTCKTLNDFSKNKDRFGIVVSPYDQGLIFTDSSTVIITEYELFGNSYVASRRNNKNVQADAIIRNLAELKIDEKIVHYKYGIGLYKGLEIRNINGVNKEFFCLEYADSAKLYVEITELHLISRYTGGSNPQLSKLGSETWVKNRNKAQEKVKDVAVQLLDVYSKRAIKKGFAFKFDRKAYNNFIADFPYEETEDQKRAIESVISDMTQAKTMDRLICGDVGFGKTEVAIRAAFVAVSNNKQVAILVPTVLLAEQHYESFRTRFANEAVNIEVLSRFKTPTEQKKVLADLAEGKIDIIIGTHKLLNKTVKYSDLGLLIVDEEHRFGVKQKEIIKAIRSDVDILTLTATPIPRTLNMAFSGLRDLSLITTPPAKRLAIKTFLKQTDNALIRETIMRELKRGGQVYFLHNDVTTIEKRAEDLANLVPEAKIEVAHGQMNERHLGMIMNNFYHQKFNVLVCTTIIETGIDIPSANTIIIERADKFGLAQLHQIRGRVGRSNHQAYAYLLTPPPKLISKDAVKRLEAITMHEDLGVGFALANHDLEIRGAGELLGDEQSGQIASVGFTLYMEMLNNAIKALKEGEELSLMELSDQTTEINLNISAIIPNEYVGDISFRLSFYKRLASVKNNEELRRIKEELIDRFGPLPDEVESLLDVTRLRMKAEEYGITNITMSNVTNFISFKNDTKVEPMKLVSLMQRYPNQFKLENDKLKILIKLEPRDRLKFIQDLVAEIC